MSETSYTLQQMLADLQGGLSPLECSKRKWTAIVEDGGRDEGRSNCACCHRYTSEEHDDCYNVHGEACPLLPGGCCAGLYGAWLAHHVDVHGVAEDSFKFCKVECDECLYLAKRILRYIENVLESEGKNAN